MKEKVIYETERCMTDLKGQRTKGSIHCGYGSGGDGK